VPPELIKGFLNGSKHPVSAIMEYSSMVRAETTFREACVEQPSYKAKFACVCTVNGVMYPQGTGTTKKDAKTEAGKLAFTAILGIEDDDIDEGGKYNVTCRIKLKSCSILHVAFCFYTSGMKH
jgi:hypothetical protein